MFISLACRLLLRMATQRGVVCVASVLSCVPGLCAGVAAHGPACAAAAHDAAQHPDVPAPDPGACRLLSHVRAPDAAFDARMKSACLSSVPVCGQRASPAVSAGQDRLTDLPASQRLVRGLLSAVQVSQGHLGAHPGRPSVRSGVRHGLAGWVLGSTGGARGSHCRTAGLCALGACFGAVHLDIICHCLAAPG